MILVAELMSLGVYIHYPFCRRRCDYCDFAIAVAPIGRIDHERYRDHVLAELDAKRGDYAGARLVSIYFGGGTPSLWPAEHLDAVVGAVSSAFSVSARRDSLEITLEANPIDCDADAIRGFRDAGINRLSVGVQSFDAGELVVLGRDHSMGDGADALAAIADAGIERVSVDVILGTPGSAGGGLGSVRRAADFEPEHMSVYELTFEDNAPLGRAAARGEIRPRESDELADLYIAAHHELVGRGYEHYEISSYAMPGARAVHNSLYWTGGQYLGLGASACSFRQLADGGAVRETNRRAVDRYLEADPGDAIASSERLTAAEAATDRLWLALRTADGVDLDALSNRPGLCDWLLEGDLARVVQGRIRPTLNGFLYADRVAARVVS